MVPLGLRSGLGFKDEIVHTATQHTPLKPPMVRRPKDVDLLSAEPAEPPDCSQVRPSAQHFARVYGHGHRDHACLSGLRAAEAGVQCPEAHFG